MTPHRASWPAASLCPSAILTSACTEAFKVLVLARTEGITNKQSDASAVVLPQASTELTHKQCSGVQTAAKRRQKGVPQQCPVAVLPCEDQPQSSDR